MDSVAQPAGCSSRPARLAGIEKRAKEIIDWAYANPRWSMAALAELPLEIPPKDAAAT